MTAPLGVCAGTLAGVLALSPAPPPDPKVEVKGRTLFKKDKELSRRTDRPWIERWAPEPMTLEAGVFGGLMLPSPNLQLFDPHENRPQQGYRPFDRVAPDVGVRVGWLPIRHFGVEAEGAYVPTKTRDYDMPVSMFAVRGHLIGQVGLRSIVPFVVAGAGTLGATSPDYAVGNDADLAFHFGLGAKAYINRRIMARLDLRDTLSPRAGLSAGAANSFEVLLGVGIVFGRERDRDETRKAEAEPEPEAPSDRDEDGFADAEDKCPDVPGVAPDGCPAAVDTDGDGFVDAEDQCPEEPGVAPDGCPDRDPDKDGILDPDDQCQYEPETANGYEDEDGCPDVPPDVQQFEGVLPGINFDVGKATIQKDSTTVLDLVVEELKKYEGVRVEISGHTDTTGPRELNMELSRARAQRVKEYLVDQGIDPGRVEVRGAGPDEPIDSNANPGGRANNRRIEFRVLD